VGWRVVSPELFKLSGEQTLISQSVAILMSVAAGAKVINMSLSADCIEFGINWCDPVIAGLFGKFFCALFQLAYPGVALPCAVIVTWPRCLKTRRLSRQRSGWRRARMP